MKEVSDESQIESIGRAIGARARWRIINVLKEKKQMTLSQLVKELKEWQFQVIHNHCRILQEEEIIDMWKEKGGYGERERLVVKLKRIPHIYIEEVE
jgi:hypothetical protein